MRIGLHELDKSLMTAKGVLTFLSNHSLIYFRTLLLLFSAHVTVSILTDLTFNNGTYHLCLTIFFTVPLYVI